jgi:hypothetical protein
LTTLWLRVAVEVDTTQAVAVAAVAIVKQRNQ